MTGSRRFFGSTLGQSVPDRAFMFEFLPPRVRLQGDPHAGEREARQIAEDFERFRDGLPRPLEAYVHPAYGLDLASTYGGFGLRTTFPQTSMHALSRVTVLSCKVNEAGLL